VLFYSGNAADVGLLQVIVVLAGTNNHDHTASQIVEGLLEIVKTCQDKQPQADILVMVRIEMRSCKFLHAVTLLSWIVHVTHRYDMIRYGRLTVLMAF